MQMKSHLRKLFSPAEQAFYDLVECEVERAGEGEGVGSAPLPLLPIPSAHFDLHCLSNPQPSALEL